MRLRTDEIMSLVLRLSIMSPFTIISFGAISLVFVLSGANSNEYCKRIQSCSDCIRSPECSWCMQEGNCVSRNSQECSQEDNFDPLASIVTLRNNDLTVEDRYRIRLHSSYSDESTSTPRSVRIKPQRMELKLRVGEPQTIKFKYSLTNDFPMDIYFLLNSPNSWENKQHLIRSTQSVIDSISDTTSNFRIGFGIFGQTGPSLEPARFKNILPLGNETAQIREAINQLEVSTSPAVTGQRKAIVQAITCKDQLLWRKDSIKVIVVMSDDFAPEDQINYYLPPNDKQCHLDASGTDSYSTLQQSPDFSDINEVVKENFVYTIIAATEAQLDSHRRFSQNIEGSTATILEASHLTERLHDIYNRASVSVNLRDNANPDLVQVRYYSTWPLGQLQPKTVFNDLKATDIMEVEAKVEVISCPISSNRTRTEIFVVDMDVDEKIILDIEIFCSCPFEQSTTAYEEPYAPQCSYRGRLTDQGCYCADGYFGRFCEVSANQDASNQTCIATSGSNLLCQGRGECVFGRCECDQRVNPEEYVYGTYCECDNYSCDRKDGLICSGPDNGICQCGVCQCLNGWTGPTCDCKASADTCRNPESNEICSNQGRCECGNCICDADYSGRYCERSPQSSALTVNSQPSQCDELKDCVTCRVYNTGPLSSDECRQCPFVPVPVAQAIVDRSDVVLCTYEEDYCQFKFSYVPYGVGQFYVRAQEFRICA